MEKKSSNKKSLIGIVVSDKMEKTIVVSIERYNKHPLYKKYVRTRKKYKAHDEKNECRVGDTVKIMECRPLSKFKKWRLVEVMKKAEII